MIARIKKGEFNGADYVLFGVVSSIDFTDALHPIRGTSNATRQYGLQLLADFSLINTKTYEIKAAFSAQGEGNDTRSLSTRGDIAPPNRPRSSARPRKASRKTCTCNWPTSSATPTRTFRAVCAHPSPWGTRRWWPGSA